METPLSVQLTLFRSIRSENALVQANPSQFFTLRQKQVVEVYGSERE